MRLRGAAFEVALWFVFALVLIYFARPTALKVAYDKREGDYGHYVLTQSLE
jgi:hypothetical protein